MPVITVLSVTPITEHYREAVIEDRFYRRINEVMTGPILNSVEQTDQQLVDHAVNNSLIPVRSEYRVIARGYDEQQEIYAAQVLGFDRELEETVMTPTIKAPLNQLPADFDNLSEAERHEALIHYGRTIGWVNWPDY